MPKGLPDKILVVDDEPLVCDFLREALSLKGYEVIVVRNGRKALNILKRNNIAAVITDVRMPEMSGLALLNKIREFSPSVPVVIITAHGTVNGAVDMMKRGAIDYITKPFSPARLYETMEKVMGNRRDGGELSRKIVTADPEMLRILETARIVAKRKASVFIQGESGTGKEMVARAIHELSDRCDKPFVAVNCAAVPESLLENELFGHERGSFTGATSKQIGKFEHAHRGTLLLDEIVEMATPLQAKLLRVLQEDEIDRIGSNTPTKIDVRIIAITNRNVNEEIRKGRFRSDLFYRLCVVPITVPPLREREGDIPLLVEHFLNVFSKRAGTPVSSISEEAMKALQAYSWPGNVRELMNVVENATMLCKGDILSPRYFSFHGLETELPDSSWNFDGITLYEAEKRLIMNTLRRVDFNKTRAAKLLGTTPRTIRNKLKRYMAEEET